MLVFNELGKNVINSQKKRGKEGGIKGEWKGKERKKKILRGGGQKYGYPD